MRADDLPDVATVTEIAAFARVDPRTLRAEILAGNVPGAFRVGQSWRIVAQTYLRDVGGHHEADDVARLRGEHADVHHT